MIYYIHPLVDSETPTGGVLKIFEHIKILNDNNIKAMPVYYVDSIFSNKFEILRDSININLKWADISLKSISINKLLSIIKQDDVVVIPEIRPFLIKFFTKIKYRVIFIQNLHKIKPKKFGLKKKDSYKSIGYNYAITCSNFLTKYIKGDIKNKNGGNHFAGDIPIFTVNNSANDNIFFRNDIMREENRVIMLNRKGKRYINKIIKMTKQYSYNFKIIKQHISQYELANEFRKSDIYIHTGFPEGFGLPVLEAQLCGCVSIGFTGGGAEELMINNYSSLVSKDGDVKNIVKNLKILLTNKNLKEKLRKNGYTIALQHNIKQEQQKLLDAFNKILN